MPTPSEDDDIAANRIRHADGTIVSGPVDASAAIVHNVLNRLNPMAITASAERQWLEDMLALSAAP